MAGHRQRDLGWRTVVGESFEPARARIERQVYMRVDQAWKQGSLRIGELCRLGRPPAELVARSHLDDHAAIDEYRAVGHPLARATEQDLPSGNQKPHVSLAVLSCC